MVFDLRLKDKGDFMDKSNYFPSLIFFFYSTFFLYPSLFAENHEPNCAFFCLVDSVGNVSESCTGPKLIKSDLNTFSGLYTDVQKKSLSLNPKSRIFNPLIGQSTSQMTNQMLPKSQLDTYHLNTIPNIINWHQIQKITIFGGSQSEGQVVIPNRNWIHTSHKNQSIILATIFLPPDAYGGDKLTEQISWLLDPTSDVAQNLVDLAILYGFDGYFINAESSAAQDRLSDFKPFMEKITSIANKSNYPLHIEWYVVGNVSISDTVIDNAGTKISGSSFIDHYSWYTFNTLWQQLDPQLKVKYNPWDIEYGAYNFTELDEILSTYTTSSSVSYFTFNGIASPDHELLANEKQQDQNLISFWQKYGDNFDATPVTYQLPFYTSFNTGKGGDFYIAGVSQNYGHWNEIGLQTPLPSIQNLDSKITFDYNTVYAGGSSLALNMTKQYSNRCTKFFCCCFKKLKQNVNVNLFNEMNLDLKLNPVELGISYFYQGNTTQIKSDNLARLCINNNQDCCFTLDNTTQEKLGTWNQNTYSLNSKVNSCQIEVINSISIIYHEFPDKITLNLGELYLTDSTELMSYKKNLDFDRVSIDLGEILSWSKDPKAIYYDIYNENTLLAETVHTSYWINSSTINPQSVKIIPIYPNFHSTPFK